MSAVFPAETGKDLAAFYTTRTKEWLGEPPPPLVTRAIRTQCERMLDNGNSPRMIRRGLELLVRQKKHPSLLQYIVLDAMQGKIACEWDKHPNKFRLTPEELLECGCSDCLETIPLSDFYGKT